MRLNPRWIRAVLILSLALFANPVSAGEDVEPSKEAYRNELRGAVDHSREGRFAEAMGAYERALEIASENARLEWRAHILRERGISYLAMHSERDARRDFDEALQIFVERGDVAAASKVRMRIASVLMNDDSEAARRLLQRVEDDLAAAGDEKALLQARLFNARLLVTEGKFEEALPFLIELRARFKANGSLGRVADVLNLESWTLQQLGRLEDARRAYLALIDTSFQRGNQELVAYAYCNLGDIEAELGHPVVARETLDRALDALDEIRARIPGGDQARGDWLDTQVSAYDRMIALLIDDGRPIEALSIAERFHARSLLEEFESPDRSLETGNVTQGEREILLPMLAIQRKLVERGLTEDEIASLRKLEQRWAHAGRERRRDAMGSAGTGLVRSIAETQRRLPPATAMLAYWVHEQRSWLWVVLPSRVELIQIPIGREALGAAIESYLVPIRDRVRAEDLELRGGSRGHLQQGAELHRLLIEPAARYLEEIDHLIIVPDDQLWYLPFETLVSNVGEPIDAGERVWFEDYAQASFLIHEFSTLYAPSASVWLELAERESRGVGVLAIAPSLENAQAARQRGLHLSALPGAVNEAQAIAATLEAGRTLIGEEAHETTIKNTLSNYQVIHFATHGYVHPERPLFSGLFLWPGAPGDDGLLQGFEVLGLDIRAELVSLAACDSGLGQLSHAEGIVGLSRAFLVAGARNVLLALWAVDDRASERLMQRFYRETQEAHALPQALRQARLDLFNQHVRETVVVADERVSYAHPYFWATYVMIGGDRLEPALLSSAVGGARVSRRSSRTAREPVRALLEEARSSGDRAQTP